MQATFTDEVDGICQAINDKIGPQKYRVWFKNSTTFTVTDECVNIGVPNQFIASWIENHFNNDITESVREVTGSDKRIIFGIEPSLAGSQKRSQLDWQAKQVTKANEPGTRPRRKHSYNNQINLKLKLEDFVVGSGNELAYSAAKAIVSERKTMFNPLFIHGGYGLGKTHLLQGICNSLYKENPEVNLLYVSAEQFANQFVLALKTQKLDAFRKRFRNVDLLAIDDIHFLASKPSMQEEFLHTFNTIDTAGKQVVLASDAHPKMIGKLCEKLVNRFVSGMVVKVDSPDLETRCTICRKWAKTMGKQIPEAVIQYIAEKMRTNIRELEGAMLKLVAYGSLNKDGITLETAQEVLADHISRTDPIVHISDIASAVTTYFGVTTADIHSSKKDRTVSLARSFSMYLARKYTKLSFPEIGKLMGGKNHATVILACRKIENFINKDSQIKWSGPSGNRVARARETFNQLIETIA